MPKLHGELDELKAAVDAVTRGGEWEAGANGQRCFRVKTGEVLNRWPKTGTWTMQGANPKPLEGKLQEALGGGVVVAAKAAQAAKIFVVHGHDRETRDQLAGC